MMILHILSVASWQTPSQAETDLAVRRDSLKPEVTMRAIMAAVNCPIPCMAKTDPIIAPRHFVVANLEGEFRKRAGQRRYWNLLRCDD